MTDTTLAMSLKTVKATNNVTYSTAIVHMDKKKNLSTTVAYAEHFCSHLHGYTIKPSHGKVLVAGDLL